jgi:hypothetical protein
VRNSFQFVNDFDWERKKPDYLELVDDLARTSKPRHGSVSIA